MQGEQEEYYRPDNSLLPHVLTAKKGIPISLAVIHAAVAQRAVGAPLAACPLMRRLAWALDPPSKGCRVTLRKPAA